MLVAGGLLIQLPGLLWGLPGGKAVNNAHRILNGEIPYRDFWTMYAPGHFYLVAITFKLFGTHVWTQAVLAQLLYAIDGALFFAILRRLGVPARFSLALGSMLVLAHWSPGEVTSYEPALVCLLLAIDRGLAYAHGGGPRLLLLAGLLCGVAAWFKHDIAFHVTVGLTGGLSLAWWLAAGRRPLTWRPPAIVLLRVGAGAALGALPVVAWLAWKAGPDAWQDLIVFPAGDFRIVRGEPYPPVLPNWSVVADWISRPSDPGRAASATQHLARWVQGNVPQVLYLGLLIVLVRSRRTLHPSTLAAGAVALAAMPLFWSSAHVQQNTHLFSLWMFSTLIAALVWSGRVAGRPAQPWSHDRSLRAVGAAVSVLLLVHTLSLLQPTVRHLAEAAFFWRDHAVLAFPSVAGIRVPRARYEFQQPIVSFIRQHVPESEPIYSGLMRHDAVVISNQIFYYLSGRPIASRYNELHPGVVDLESVQREIIGDLERLHVRCAILWDFGWPKSYMDQILARRREQIPGIGATLLDEYFRREFETVGRYGEYVLVWRRGVPMPPPPAPATDR
jgi:hypothetical protein